VLLKKGVRYYSLLTDDKKRILHIHHSGPERGEIHLDKRLWRKLINLKELVRNLEDSYEVVVTEDDIRLKRYIK
jgi:hypothetical protein